MAYNIQLVDAQIATTDAFLPIIGVDGTSPAIRVRNRAVWDSDLPTHISGVKKRSVRTPPGTRPPGEGGPLIAVTFSRRLADIWDIGNKTRRVNFRNCLNAA